MADYKQLVEVISRTSGLLVEDIERKIEAKRAKLSGLISKEGAAQIVAAELGINFEKRRIKINEIMDGMRRINTVGKIIQLFPIREFKKENREGKVSSFVIADETGNVRIVLWDTNHIALVEKGEIKDGDVIEISSGVLRNGELHLTAFSDIRKSQEIIERVKAERDYSERKLKEVKIGESAKMRAFIVQSFKPRFFDICPECNGKILQESDGPSCSKHGRVVPLKRALINLVLDDGTENVRAVLFSEQIGKLNFNLENSFIEEREAILGKEMVFSGTMRQNKLFNNDEFFVSDIKDIELDNLIASLEK